MGKEVIYTQKELEKRLKYWQKRLNLRDWKFTIGIARASSLGGEHQGGINWELNSKSAMIRILDPEDYPGGTMVPQDMENTLVHELVHVHFAAISEKCNPKPSDIYSFFEEQAIEALTDTLIQLERK